MLREINQKEKDIYQIISHIRGIWNKKQENKIPPPNIITQTHKYREDIDDCQGEGQEVGKVGKRGQKI